MKKTNLSKYIYIIVAMVILLVVYFYWKGKDTPSSTLDQTNIEDQAAGARVLVLLNQVSSLKIDTKLFEEPAYLTLRDYTVEVLPLPVGRVNPFAPIPGTSIPRTGR